MEKVRLHDILPADTLDVINKWEETINHLGQVRTLNLALNQDGDIIELATQNSVAVEGFVNLYISSRYNEGEYIRSYEATGDISLFNVFSTREKYSTLLSPVVSELAVKLFGTKRDKRITPDLLERMPRLVGILSSSPASGVEALEEVLDAMRGQTNA